MLNFSKRFKQVSLFPKSEYAKKILNEYPKLLLVEFNNLGEPLDIAPNGSQGIFCMSPDGFWQGWFELDKDVLFEQEEINIRDIISTLKDSK